jgi:hypothetical protein
LFLQSIFVTVLLEERYPSSCVANNKDCESNCTLSNQEAGLLVILGKVLFQGS